MTISPAVLIQYKNVTDRQTDIGQQKRPQLRIALDGKNLSKILMKYFGQLECVTSNKLLYFGGDLDPDVDPGILDIYTIP